MVEPVSVIAAQTIEFRAEIVAVSGIAPCDYHLPCLISSLTRLDNFRS